jgi:hypothetical protein
MAKTPLPAVKDAFDPVFTRSQIEWALWRHQPDAKAQIPSSFKMRCKHLLELDRSEGKHDGVFAFSDEPPQSQGDHGLFSFFDAMMLSTALGFLGLGFKRREVVLFLRERRAHYRKSFGPLLNRKLADALAGKPPTPEHERHIDRLRIVVKRLDPAPTHAKGSREVLLSKSEIEQVTRGDFDSCIILDLTYTARNLAPFLLKAPQRRRGPR